MKKFIGITGTTSVGKSDVAIRLAKMMNTQIISADSMQVYRGMNIGTAKISPEQMQGIKHYMIDIVDPNESYSSFLYQEHASQIIDHMNSMPIVVGGTGFYFDSLLYPPEFGNSASEYREQLKKILEEQGLASLQELLKQQDKQTYDSIDLQNTKRVMRALEICAAGEKKSEGKGRQQQPRYEMTLIVLQRDRQQLYSQIDSRVEKMVENGLVQEVQDLVNRYGICDTSAFSAIGYKEIIEYLNGAVTLEQAVNNIKLNTRHYAKRQITYYKKMNVAEYIDVEGQSSDEIAQYIYKKYCGVTVL